MARFNTQAVLTEVLENQREMRQEQRALATRCDEGFEKIATTMATHELEDTKQFAAIDKRVEAVENMRRAFRWLGATFVVTMLGALASLALSYFKGVHP